MFLRKERELRRLIASNESGQDDSLIWHAGSIQTGDDSRIELKHGDTVCDGEIVSDAHTHPRIESKVIFSIQDLYSFIASSKTSTFVINSSFATCLFIKTDNLSKISNNFYWDASTEILPFFWEGTYSQRLTWYAQHIGIGLYCGDLNKKIKRIIPEEQHPPNIPPGLYILGAKAYLSSLERLEANPIRVAADFRPEVDEIFSKYLTDILPKRPNRRRFKNINLNANNPTPKEIFRYAHSFFHKSDKEFFFNIGNFQCLPDTGNLTCTSGDNFWTGKGKNIFAEFSYATQDFYWVEGDHRNGFYRISENPSKKNRYMGSCKFSNKQCIPNGMGTLKTSDFEYYGEFRDGKMDGDGEIRKSPQNEAYKVKMANDEIKEIKRVK